MNGIKKILCGVFAVAFVVIFVVLMIKNPAPEHIEDTNGAKNYTLQTIKEEDVVEQKLGSRGAISERETKFEFLGLKVSDGKKYSSKKFTGVYLLHAETIFKGSDIHISLAEFKIKSGNFAFYVVFDGEVVGKVTPSDDVYSEFILENVEKTATLEYIIAGESADFEFIAPFGIE